MILYVVFFLPILLLETRYFFGFKVSTCVIQSMASRARQLVELRLSRVPRYTVVKVIENDTVIVNIPSISLGDVVH